MKNNQTSSHKKHRVTAIILSWPGHKYLLAAKNTTTQQSQHAIQKVAEFPVIIKHDHTELWREAESIIAATEKPLQIHYVLFFENSPMFGGEKTIPASFTHGDFARSIIHTCKHGAPWMASLTKKRREEVMELYKMFRQNHEIIVTHK